jgi:hypothetical protein
MEVPTHDQVRESKISHPPLVVYVQFQGLVMMRWIGS